MCQQTRFRYSKNHSSLILNHPRQRVFKVISIFTQMDSFIQNRSQWYVLFQSNFWTQWALIKAIKRSYHSEKSFYILELNSSKLPTIQEIRTEILTTIMDALEVNFLESFVSVQIIGQRVFANCVKQVEFQVLRSVISRLNSGIFWSFDLIK